MALPGLVIAALVFAWSPAPASACEATKLGTFGVAPGCFDMVLSGTPTATDLAPNFTQAGGHPYQLDVAAMLNSPAEGSPVYGPLWPPEPLKDLRIGLTPGLIANPTAAEYCPFDKLTESSGLEAAPACSPASQVGTASIDVAFFGATPLSIAGIPLYNLRPAPGSATRFGLNVLGTVTIFDGTLPPDPASGIDVEVKGMNEALALDGLSVSLWGTPAGADHDAERSCPGEAPASHEGPTCPAGIPPRAFLRLPTSCDGPVTTSLEVSSWADPGEIVQQISASHLAPSLFGNPLETSEYPVAFPGFDSAQWGPVQGLTECGKPAFEPSLGVRPTNAAPGEPTGLDISVNLRQQGLQDPEAIGPTDLRSATIVLPEQLMANASVANGLGACTSAEVGLGSPSEPHCPDSAKLGTVLIRSPLLNQPLQGSIYLASAHAATSGLKLSAYLVAGNEAATIKLPAEINVDGSNGQATAKFDDLPQLPISELTLSFFPGERAPFVAPRTCGTYASAGDFVPWARNERIERDNSFQISEAAAEPPCPHSPRDLPLHPRLLAGVTDPVAGKSSPLRLELSRDGHDQVPKRFEASLPEGVSASLLGVARCPEPAIATIASHNLDGGAELATPSCPPDSKVGDAVVSVGSGDEPLRLNTGQIYLAGPYGGAPLSLAIAIPAVTGPVDLGTVLVRVGLAIDRRSGRLTLDGELPTMQAGVSLNLRRVVLNINRPGFILNPTGCRPTTIDAMVAGEAGAVAKLSSPFQIHDCGALGFQPKLEMRLLGGRQAARRAAHPTIRIALRTSRGDANVADAIVTLPAVEQIDLSHLRGICSTTQFWSGSCRRRSLYGSARVFSRSLAEPLSGPVYLLESRHGFPDIAIDLRGELGFILTGRIGFADGRVRIALRDLPDLPLAKLALTLDGGRQGLLVNSRDLCRRSDRARVVLRGENGKSVEERAGVRTPCKGGT